MKIKSNNIPEFKLTIHNHNITWMYHITIYQNIPWVNALNIPQQYECHLID